jgi:putative DNA primase/helicase
LLNTDTTLQPNTGSAPHAPEPLWENLPAELTELPQWLLWRYELTAKGKWTKVPYQQNKRRASTTDRNTRSSFESIKAAYLKNGGFDGIGFVFAADSGLVGFDFDHVIGADGSINDPTIARYIKSLASYTELSPSGTGLHVLVRGKLPQGGRKRGPIECYDRVRYFTISGRHWPGSPKTINERQAEIEAFHSEVFGARAAELTAARSDARPLDSAPDAQPAHIDDAELLERARHARNGTRFTALYDLGNWQGEGFPSQSEADLWLLARLAFWTGRDAGRMESLFRKSALMRDDKWNRASYGNPTIAAAIAGCANIYSPYECTLDVDPDTGELIAGSGSSNGIVPQAGDADHNQNPNLDADARPARNISEKAPSNTNKLKTEEIAGIISENEHFAQDQGGRLYVFQEGVYHPRGEEYIRRQVLTILKCRRKNWSVHIASEVVEYIRVASPLLWDRPELEIINLKNGLFNVNDSKLMPHDPAQLSTVQLPVIYDPEAKCPAWENQIEQTFPEDAREEGIAWEIIATLMIPLPVQKAILLLGEGGSGKSTFLAAVRAFLGANRNVSAISLHKLENDKFAVARLVGKLANICPDLPSTHLKTSSIFRAITGGDAVCGEYKFKDSFDFIPFARLIFSANQPPQSDDATDAFFDRWLVISFNRKWRGEAGEIYKLELDARLAAPGELSGVLNRALEVLPRVRKHGITITSSMREAGSEFRAATDPIERWLDQNTVEHPNCKISKEALLRKFNRDAPQDGRPVMTANMFGRELKRRRPNVTQAQRTTAGRIAWCWIGLGLRASTDAEFDTTS